MNEEEAKAIEHEIIEIGANFLAEFDEVTEGRSVAKASMLSRISELIDAEIRLASSSQYERLMEHVDIRLSLAYDGLRPLINKLVEAETIAEKRLTNLEAIPPASSTITRVKTPREQLTEEMKAFDAREVKPPPYEPKTSDPEHGNNDSMTGPDEEAPVISLQEQYHGGIADKITDAIFNMDGVNESMLHVGGQQVHCSFVRSKIMEILKA